MKHELGAILTELRGLELSGLYERDFVAVGEKSDGELAGVFAVADALRELRSRNYATRIFQTGLGLWEGPEGPGYAAFAAACAMLGLSCARLERLTPEVLAAAAPDLICAPAGWSWQLDELYRAGTLEQRPLALPQNTALPLVLHLLHQSGGAGALRGREAPAMPEEAEDLAELSRRFGLVQGDREMEDRERWALESLRPYVLAAMALLGKCPEPVRILEGFQRRGEARRSV